ncbi:hypothetical protein ACIQNU_43075 [Streptomyces sp. NPDC091292]|uniref:hypothetical protein n=1 Tax=Streptomyces sp. NPDC091292 TaxID=3365991 RepID=UPI0038268F39
MPAPARELIRQIALEYGVANPRTETRVGPSGVALWGVRCLSPSRQRGAALAASREPPMTGLSTVARIAHHQAGADFWSFWWD